MRHPISFSLCVALVVLSCKAEPTTGPPSDDFEDGLIGSSSHAGSRNEQQRLDELYGARPDLPARSAPEERCEGEGQQRKCTLVDPASDVSAAHGVRELMVSYRWGMDPSTVLEQIKNEIENDYRQRMGSDAMAQDRLRREMEAELDELPSHRVRFDSASPHQWRVTVIENLFADDAEEEMVWVGAQTDKRFYMFKNGKLWAINRAYPSRQWPNKTLDQIVEEAFARQFGISPTFKEERDEGSGMLRLRYAEWASRDGDTIRAYDLSEAHGAILLSVFNAKDDQALAARLPSNKLDAALSGVEDISDIMRDEGICYDEDGNMIHDPERCKGGGKADSDKAKSKAAKTKATKGKK